MEEPIADRKLQFAPFKRQARAIERLLEQECFRSASEFIRAAIDHYLEHLGRPLSSPAPCAVNELGDEAEPLLPLLDEPAVDELSSQHPAAPSRHEQPAAGSSRRPALTGRALRIGRTSVTHD